MSDGSCARCGGRHPFQTKEMNERMTNFFKNIVKVIGVAESVTEQEAECELCVAGNGGEPSLQTCNFVCGGAVKFHPSYYRDY